MTTPRKPAAKKTAAKKTAKRTTGRVTPKKVVIAPFWLDIACGQTKGHFDPALGGIQNPEGWTGIDRAPTKAADIVHDLNIYPWIGVDGKPIPDNSVDRARCSHYIEHIPHDIGHPAGIDGFIAFGNELHRILKHGAQCEFVAPYYSSMRATQDPTHTRSISEATFYYWNQDWLKINGLDHYGVTADFDFGWAYNLVDPRWTTPGREETRDWAIIHYLNVVTDLVVTVTKKEPSNGD